MPFTQEDTTIPAHTVSPQLATNWSIPTPGTNEVGGCLADGKVWLCNGSSVYGYDQFTGQQIAQFHFDVINGGTSPRYVQPYAGGLVVGCTDHWVYTIDLVSTAITMTHLNTDLWKISWMQADGSSVYVAGDYAGVQRLMPPEQGGGLASGAVVSSYGISGLTAMPALGGGYVFFAVGDTGGVTALDATGLYYSGWSVNTNPPGPVTAPLSCHGSVLFYAANNGDPGESTVYAVSTVTRQILWSVQTQATISAQIIADSKFCYVPAGDVIEMHDVLTGALMKSFQVQGTLTGTMLLDDGILYATDDERLYTINITTDLIEVFTTDSKRPSLIGLHSGIAYFSSSQHVYAARLADVLREFYAEAHLMQDFHFDGTAQAPLQKPTYHTEITLVDQGGSPRGQQDVRVWATSPTTITWSGTTYHIDEQTYAQLTTDVMGKLRLTSLTGDNDSQGTYHDGLVTPGLILWAPFMEPEDTILLRPDAVVHERLASISHDDLKNTVGYDQQPLINDAYRANDDALQVATQAINQLGTMVQASVKQRNTTRDVSTHYLAPGNDPDLICCCHNKHYRCPVICEQDFAFDLRLGSPSFTYLTPEQTAARLPAAAMPRQERSLHDLWDKIKRGEARIVHAVVSAVNQIEKTAQAVGRAIINGVEEEFHVSVDTIGKATTLITGIFHTIAGPAAKVLQALSFVFDWPRIVDVHRQIASQITAAWNQLLHAEPGQPSLLQQCRTHMDQQLNSFKNQVDQALQQLKAELGGSTAHSVQQQHDDTANHTMGGAKAHWLQGKVQDHLFSPQASTAVNRAQLSATGSLSLPTFQLPADLEQDFMQVLDQLTGKVSDDLDATIARIRSDRHFYTPDQLFNTALTVFVDAVQGVVDVTLDVAQTLFDGMVRLLERLMQSMLAMVTAKIEIPFVSALYRWATHGSDLTLLDLFSLLAALPVVLTEKLTRQHYFPVTRGQQVARGQQAVAPSVVAGMRIAAGVLQSLFGVFNGLISRLAVKNGKDWAHTGRMAFGFSALVLVRGALLVPIILTAVNNTNVENLLLNLTLWVPPTLFLFMTTCAISQDTTGQVLNAASYRVIGSFVWCAWEISGLIAFAFLADRSNTYPYVISFSALVAASLLLNSIGGLVHADAMTERIALIVISNLLIFISGGVKIAEGIHTMLT